MKAGKTKTRKELEALIEMLESQIASLQLRLEASERSKKAYLGSVEEGERQARLKSSEMAARMLSAQAQLVCALADVIQPRRV